MLRKKGLIIASVVAAVLLTGSAVLIRVHFVDAAQKLLSDMTEMGIVMEDIELHYSPLPSLQIKNLQVQSGSDTVRVPLLEVYPDISSLLSGEIKLKHVVLNDPDVRAAAHREGGTSAETGPLQLPAVFPDKIDVNSGRVQLTNSYQAEPLTVSASVEKGGTGFAFNVRSASIAELGFKFSGQLEMISTSPLKLNLQASECSIDPAAFLGFLTGFGYMSNSTIPELADAGKFETKDLDFSVDSALGTMNLKSGGLVLDSTSGTNLSLQMGQGGAFQVSMDEARIDAGELYSMAHKSERGRNATAAILESAKLKSLMPQGTLILKSVVLSMPAGENAKLSGKMTISAKDLKLVLESIEGKKQEISISDIDADVELKDGKPVVSVRNLNVASATGGNFKAQASLEFPVEMRDTRFRLEAADFSIFDYVITCEAEKKNSFQTSFDTQLNHKKTSISASGYFNVPRSKGAIYEAQLKSLSIRDSSGGDGEKAQKSENAPFDFGPLLGRNLSGKASIRRFYYNDWPFSDVALYLQSGKDRALLKAGGNLFHLNLNGDVVFSKDQMAAQCNIKGRGTSLPSLIACFAKDLSVALRGKIYLNANLFMQGSDSEALVKSLSGEATAKIDQLKIFNLANIDPRLAFFIDLLNAVSTDPEPGQGLSFRTAMVRAKLAGKEMQISNFNLDGNVIQAWGGGMYSLDEKHLRLGGRVRSMLGTVNSFNIDRKLKS